MKHTAGGQTLSTPKATSISVHTARRGGRVGISHIHNSWREVNIKLDLLRMVGYSVCVFEIRERMLCFFIIIFFYKIQIRIKHKLYNILL